MIYIERGQWQRHRQQWWEAGSRERWAARRGTESGADCRAAGAM